MRPGLASASLDAAEIIAAPRTGIVLGAGAGGPALLRLLRPTGTRIVAAAGLAPTQLIALRAAAAAIPVEVRTARAAAWQPLLRIAPGLRLRGCGEPFAGLPGPALFVDDCPGDVAGGTGGGARAWQCRVEVRSDSTAAALRGFATASVAVFAALPEPLAARVGAAFELPVDAVHALTGLDARSVALVRRGRTDIVTLHLTPAEREVLGGGGEQLPRPV